MANLNRRPRWREATRHRSRIGVVTTRSQSRCLTRSIHTVHLHRHRLNSGCTHHQHRHQRRDAERGLDRDGSRISV
ncbi:Uncharacterised protein [Mycobacteroides abscessus subsp. abscessus]|nr:Uncharacterised protein [Mycobacteroides abscessus subsp. abscessus]